MKRLLIAVAAVILSACGGPRLLMRDVSSREIPPPAEGQARIVFAAPGEHRDVISIVDQRGQYVGQLGARTFFIADAEPGPHRWYALVGSSAYVVEGTVEAGRTYWILADTRFARPMRWITWSPRCDEDVGERIAEARRIEPDPQADPGGLLARQLGDVPQRILEADRELAEMPDDDRADRLLDPACRPGAPPDASAGGEAASAPATGADPGAESETEASPMSGTVAP